MNTKYKHEYIEKYHNKHKSRYYIDYLKHKAYGKCADVHALFTCAGANVVNNIIV